METTYTINLDAILDLANRKKDLWLILTEEGDKNLANAYWGEYFGVLQALVTITGKNLADAMEMVWEWDKNHND